MHWETFLEQVTERGQYTSPREAERAVRAVLALLGAHLDTTARAELAAVLPEMCAPLLHNPLRASAPLAPRGFARAAAARIPGATEKTAAWDVSAVLSVVADAAGDALLRRILLQLPEGYDVFFGRLQPA